MVTVKLAGSATINHVAFVLALDPAVAGVVPGLWAVGGNQGSGTCVGVGVGVGVNHFTAAQVPDTRRPLSCAAGRPAVKSHNPPPPAPAP